MSRGLHQSPGTPGTLLPLVVSLTPRDPGCVLVAVLRTRAFLPQEVLSGDCSMSRGLHTRHLVLLVLTVLPTWYPLTAPEDPVCVLVAVPLRTRAAPQDVHLLLTQDPLATQYTPHCPSTYCWYPLLLLLL